MNENEEFMHKNYFRVATISALLSILIGGCSNGESSSQTSNAGSKSKRNGTAEVLISQFLKDPNSAEFQVSGMNNEHLCAIVNSKNSFGGYSGFRKILITSYKTDPGVYTQTATGFSLNGTIEAPSDVVAAINTVWNSVCKT